MIFLEEGLNLPWWVTAIIAILGALGIFSEKLGINIGKNAERRAVAKSEAEADCKEKIEKLQQEIKQAKAISKKFEFVIVKLVSVIRTSANFMNNPDNAEQLKKNMEEAMDEISDVMESIEKNNSIKDG